MRCVFTSEVEGKVGDEQAEGVGSVGQLEKCVNIENVLHAEA